jgi:hypothetical protein
MVFNLVEGAQKSWRCLEGHNKLPKIIDGVKFVDWIEFAPKVDGPQTQTAATGSFRPSPEIGDSSRPCAAASTRSATARPRT